MNELSPVFVLSLNQITS